jgi:hypothetical protein
MPNHHMALRPLVDLGNEGWIESMVRRRNL